MSDECELSFDEYEDFLVDPPPSQAFVREFVRSSFSHMKRLREKWKDASSTGVRLATKIVNTSTQLTYVTSAHWGALAPVKHLPGLVEGKVGCDYLFLFVCLNNLKLHVTIMELNDELFRCVEELVRDSMCAEKY